LGQRRKKLCLTAKVLNETGLTLAGLLEQGILGATTEYGKDYVKQALAVIPATTPALCTKAGGIEIRPFLSSKIHKIIDFHTSVFKVL
jgi:hypothetical protein